jgi:hypothetical protein
MKETSIFSEDFSGKAQLIFIGGFHIGIPVSIIDQSAKPFGDHSPPSNSTRGFSCNYNGYDTISSDLKSKFEKHSSFAIVSKEYSPSISFPLGKPLILRYNNFNNVFNWKELSTYPTDDSI